MIEEVKALWVDALKSERYRQGYGCLRWGTQYDVWGVLCDLHHLEQPTRRRWMGEKSYEGEMVKLPWRVARWAGLPEEVDLTLTVEGEQRSLSDLNDAHWTFPELAALIEAQL